MARIRERVRLGVQGFVFFLHDCGAPETLRLLAEKGVVSEADLEALAARSETRAAASRVVSHSSGPGRKRAPETSFREPPAPPRFAVGVAVVTRNVHPPGHTRLPRYARGRRGVITAYRGCHVFPDTNAHDLGEQPQHVYSVRFDSRELWGETGEPNQHVYLDLWESYLLPA